MSYNLFLDDTRYPTNNTDEISAFDITRNPYYQTVEWVIVRSYLEFIETIEKNGIPDIISFDHDLKDEHYIHYSTYTVYTNEIDYNVVKETGWHCAKWFLEYFINNKYDKFPEILLHTQNKIGA